jgi:hypothetical protein
MAQGFGGLNLKRVFDVTHFEEILESLMQREFLNFSINLLKLLNWRAQYDALSMSMSPRH